MIPALRATNADVPLYVDFIAELRLRGFEGDLSTSAGARLNEADIVALWEGTRTA
jgi:hypothetical protein